MTTGPAEAKQQLIEEAASFALRKVDDEHAEEAAAFVRAYYERVPPRDLESRSAVDVYGAAMAHRSLAHHRDPGTPIVRVSTPTLEQDGWQSTHSVVEIVTDDMPFLVDSVTMCLSRRDLGIHLLIHPVLAVRRDDDGRLLEITDSDGDDTGTESFIHVEFDRQTAPEVLDELRDGLLDVLAEVRAAVTDWQPMRDELQRILDVLDDAPAPVDDDELAEGREFLRWLDDDHFTFLGFRTYDLAESDDGEVLESVPGTGLGIMRDAPESKKRFTDQPPEVHELAHARTLLILTKANSRSRVHRPTYLDYVGVKRFGEDGEPIGEWRFLGLYTSDVYSAQPQDIPVVRRKVAAVLDRAHFPAGSHDEKDLTAILEHYPRDDLFEISTDELFDIAMGILGLQERRQVRLFVRRDHFGRYFSCLVYVPRDRYNTESRLRMQDVLSDAFNATGVEHSVRLSESVLARLHFTVHAGPEGVREADVEEVERRLADAAREWPDDLRDALIDELGEERGTQLFTGYADAFPAAYRDDYLARIAVADIQRLEDLAPEGDLSLSLYRPVEIPEGFVRLKLYRSGSPIALSDVLPLLENMGVAVFDQRPYRVTPADGEALWIYDFGLRHGHIGALDTEQERRRFRTALTRVWAGDSESDGFNRLVLGAGLGWRDVTLLRAYSKYLRQGTTRFSQQYMEDALVGNGAVAGLLCELFHTRLSPERAVDGGPDRDAVERVSAEFDAALADVASLDEDRILRSFRDCIGATLRTNHYQTIDGDPKPYLSLKFDPERIPALPLPRPAFEIFVYAPGTEGVHLRGGAVARGGLRWSDRREDFRTEVLGLMKAQSVKNAVIVPVGAKGGFVVKTPAPDDPQEHRERVKDSYRTFIRGLLDVTDNILDGDIVHPPDVVRHDGDDPYLVVAADKGTATFSDTANAVSEAYGFWLGDAFASGGATGYDHKEMGITARGAWESVKQHFRELGTDIQTTDFTVAGVGDMSGDVFGNGMLLSRHIRLVAAFDHRHLFLDPDPDAEAGFAERTRLFELPRSSWDDYDREAISPGGGVWSRDLKSVQLSPEARDALGVEEEELTPDEVVQAILRAPVDLLFNGGIGTFVKASSESDADVGDKTTERVRVDADTLRCRVVGEGGNLGFTQRARVEYALEGGRINTDAIDNSAGVDCSDHEVNIKILLDQLVAEDELTRTQRNDLLEEMTDEVARLVLANNYAQTRALSNSMANAAAMVDVHRRYLEHLEERVGLNRALEALPPDEQLQERAEDGRGLTRPEFAVLLAYTKTSVYDDLLDSELPEDPWLRGELEDYFPSALRDGYAEQMREHPLRREIIATQVANTIVNDAGTTFLFRLSVETGADAVEIAPAYTAAREIFRLAELLGEVDALDNQVGAQVQTKMVLEGRKLVERGTRWLLRHRSSPLDIRETVSFFAPGAEEVAEHLPGLLRGMDREDADDMRALLVDEGVPDRLAQRVAYLPAMYCALDQVSVADEEDAEVDVVADIYFRLAEELQLDWLRDQIGALPRDTRWQTLARDALREDFFTRHRALTTEVLQTTGGQEPGERVEVWRKRNATQIRRYERMLTEIRMASSPDLAMLSVGLREIRNLVRATG